MIMSKNIISKIKYILKKNPFSDSEMSIIKNKLPFMKSHELREMLALLEKREKIVDDSTILSAEIRGAEESGEKMREENLCCHHDSDIAIIGMSAKSSLAGSYREFWENLKKGLDCVREIPPLRKSDLDKYLDYAKDHYHRESLKREYLKIGYLDDIDKFDYHFFGLTPRDGQALDPGQRLFLEAAYGAIEDAGLAGSIRGSKTGIFIGYGPLKTSYFNFISTLNGSLAKRSIMGNLDAVMPSRVSHYFNLKGPSLLINTTCSSVLVALHLACRSIGSGECSQALVGGVQINILPMLDRPLLGIESKDGITRSFDDRGDGTNFCEGVGAVFIKPLKKAIADGDHIYAVIRGSAINHDGRASSLAAPNLEAQKEVILSAWSNAKINPSALSYIEAHGTGTKLGDPIEIEALTQAFAESTDKKHFCAIGSVKSNIGHASASSGLFGLLKAALSLKHREVPATIHFNEPNGKINWESTPVYVNASRMKWKRTKPQEPLLCGVSSFGISGTNCHVVLEEAPAIKLTKSQKENRNVPEIFVISAKDKSVLSDLIRRYYNFLSADDICDRNAGLADICYTAAVGREHHDHRLAIIVKSKKDLVNKLKNLREFDFNDSINPAAGAFYAEHRSIPFNEKEKGGKDIGELRIISLSKEINEKISNSGNKKSGAKKVFLGRIAESYIKGAGINWPLLYKDRSAKKISLPTYPFARTRCWIEPLTGQAPDKPQETRVLHPLFKEHLTEAKDQDIFTSEIWPEKYFFVRDHKVRGDITLPGTAYLEMAKQIGLFYYGDSPVELKKILFLAPMIFSGNHDIRVVRVNTKKHDSGFSFSVQSKINSEDAWLTHVTGELRRIEEVCQSEFFDISKLKEECGRKLKLDFYESLGKMEGETVYGPRWQCFREIREGDGRILIELALPEKFSEDLDTYYIHPALWDMATFAKGVISAHVVPFLYENIKIFNRTPKHIYGYIRDSAGSNAGDKNKKALASYDIDLMDASGRVFAQIRGYYTYNQTLFKIMKTANNLFYRLFWRKEPLKTGQEKVSGATLLLGGAKVLAAALKKKSGPENLIVVSSDKTYRKKSKNEYGLGSSQKDYDRLFADLKKRKIRKIVHALTLPDSGKAREIKSLSDLDESQERGVLSLFRLTKALQNNGTNENIDIVLLTGFAEAVTGKEKTLEPENATLVGLGKAVTLENPNFRCRSIDIDDKTKTGVISGEVFSAYSVYKTAYRDNVRYIEVLDKFDMEKASKSGVKIKPGGVYLITGGTGGIGLTIAKYLSSQNKVKLALISRGGLKTKKADGPDREKAKIIEEIRKSGSEVMVIPADVTDEKKMEKAVELIRKKFGKINGVVHAAGKSAYGLIKDISSKQFGREFDSKVHGTWLLGKICAKDKPDFMVFFSSTSTIVGWRGFAAKTAANTYINAYAQYFNKAKRVVSLHWPTWKNTGESVGVETDERKQMFRVIAPSEAVKAFGASIEKAGPNNIIAGSLNREFLSMKDFFSFEISKSLMPEKGRGAKFSSFDIFRKRQNLITASEDLKGGEGQADIKTELTRIWQRVLGYKDISLNDNFFELGGDSIMIIRVQTMIGQRLGMNIPVIEIFNRPTISALADFMEKFRTAKKTATRSIKAAKPYKSIDKN